MSSNTEIVSRHVWLIQMIMQAGPRGVLLGEVISRWEARWNTPYSRKTFCNHRDSIEEIFGIKILCNRHTNRYYIPFGEGMLDGSSIKSWLINTYTITNALTLGGERLEGRMEVEHIPSGQLWLETLIKAMDGNHVLSVSYQKYTSSEPEQLTLYPYALKEADKRWYLVAYCVERGDVRVYGLDRIIGIAETDGTFELPSDFDLHFMFASSYGIYIPEEGQKAELITLKATPRESKYLRDLPIHDSQKEVSENVFTLEVIPNDSLIMELCGRGDRIEVISPESVRSRVAEELRKALSKYEQNK